MGDISIFSGDKSLIIICLASWSWLGWGLPVPPGLAAMELVAVGGVACSLQELKLSQA